MTEQHHSRQREGISSEHQLPAPGLGEPECRLESLEHHRRCGATRGERPAGRRVPWASRIVGESDVPPGELIANPANWRRHPQAQRAAIAAALGTVGWVQRVIRNRRTGHLLDGHARVEEALARGEASVPVVEVDLSEEEERLVLATLDPLGAMAEADTAMLTELLAGITPPDETLAAMLVELANRHPIARPARTDPDRIPPPPTLAELHVRPGELLPPRPPSPPLRGRDRPGRRGAPVRRARWPTACGQTHRSGSGSPGGPAPAPPARTTVQGRRTRCSCAPCGSLRCARTAASTSAPRPVRAMPRSSPPSRRSAGSSRWSSSGQWVGSPPAPRTTGSPTSRSCTATPRDPARPGRGRHAGSAWYGDDTQGSVLAFRREAADRDHPRAQPVGLVEQCLGNSTKAGDLVYDPFLGSGTTLIAAERLGRRCLAMEIDPRSAQVAIERWTAFSGEEAVRDG